ncbi:hypothetical protein ACJJTC_003497 [Scirpophaga incertulas]
MQIEAVIRIKQDSPKSKIGTAEVKHIMDVTFNNVLEGTRQYFLGLPKQAQAEGSVQPVWPADVAPPEEGTPAQSGAPAPTSRPPSAAAAPPSTPSTVMAVAVPPRPPSEPLEPEPHIIHKATVMREAAEKRRELPQEDEESIETLSPPSHIIRKPPRTLPSPAPAPAAPCPSPARPPSAVSLQPSTVSEQQLENTAPYRTPVHRVPTPTARPPDHYAPGRPPDAYSTARPPDPYLRYHYDTNQHDGGRSSQGPPIQSPQPPMSARQSPQTYARISSSMPQHSATRLREPIPQSPPTQRYVIPVSQPPPPHNDRVPPIHHPQIAQPPQRLDVRSTQAYSQAIQQRRDTSPYGRMSAHYERQPTVSTRKYDPQHAYPGYRPTPTASQPIQNHRIETHHPTSYKQAAIDVMNSHYTTRPPDRAPVTSQLQSHDVTRVPTRGEYSNINRSVDTRSAYSYPTPSTSTARYGSSSQIPAIAQNPTSLQQRATYRSASVPKPNYDYSTASTVQTSPVRSVMKSGYPNQQARMTVSVTTLVNQMNQTKQKQDLPVAGTPSASLVNSPKHKRESPLDLSVKTVKNSADSSTTQDESIDSASLENKTTLQSRPHSSSIRHNVPAAGGYVSSHKVDFAPNFTQYRDRNIHHSNVTATTLNNHSMRFNGSYEQRRPISDSYATESQQHTYPERNKYSNTSGRTDYVSRIDLTRPVSDQRLETSRNERSYVDERKRLAGQINSNIPEKIVRYETWTSDSRMSQFAREQHDLISRPVYSYSSHKQFEAYQNEQKRPVSSISYREHHSHVNHRYTSNQYPPELIHRDQNDNRGHYHDRSVSNSNRHQVIQKLPQPRDTQQLESHSGIPADKRVLSILRNSLETKHTGFTEPARPIRQIPDLIVIDDVDDSVIEITDLTKDNETETTVKSISKHSNITPNSESHIQMPKAVDSLICDSDNPLENLEIKGKSPENDVASRIRTKAELKVMPPSHENNIKQDLKHDNNEKMKVQPKSQKQHLFNQIREDQRLESVIKNEKLIQNIIPEVKTEPMNIEEIEKDAEVSIKNDSIIKNLEVESTGLESNLTEDDLDWATACDSFMEQLKDGCHKKKIRQRMETMESEIDNKLGSVASNIIINTDTLDDTTKVDTTLPIVIKQEPIDNDELKQDNVPLANILTELITKDNMKLPERSQEQEKVESKTKDNKYKSDSKQQKYINKKGCKDNEKILKNKSKSKPKSDKTNTELSVQTSIKKEIDEKEPLKTNIKEELESTDDDEPLIKSKLLKEKERNEQLKYQLLKDLSEKSAYVKLECCDVDVNKNSRKSIECLIDKDDKQCKTKSNKQISKFKGKTSNEVNKIEKANDVSSSDDEEDEHTVAGRLRLRKNIKTEDSKQSQQTKSPVKLSTKKQESNTLQTIASSSSTPIRKPGFGDGSDFRPGWEEELYKYKRSLRMPTRLIAIPRGRSGGPFTKGPGVLFTRGSTSLPDLDPAPLSPAPSSAPSAATDDIYTRRQDKVTIDSDLESNSSYTAPHKLQYDSEASSSTVLSSSMKKKRSSIVDVLIQKVGRKDESKKKSKDKDDKTPKVIPKSTNATELLATPSLGLLKSSDKGGLSAKKEKLMEDIFYLGAFRKETVTAFRNAFIKNTDGLIGATEEFAPVVLKSRTRTESRVLKQRATMKEVFGDERPASAPPISCREIDTAETVVESIVKPKEPENKPKVKPKKIIKDKLKRRSSSIRDGLRSTQSLKRNDAKGRLLRLKKRNSIMKSLSNKRLKDSTGKHKKENSPTTEDKVKDEGSSPDTTTTEVSVKRRLKRLFGRRKFSSGFDYIRKKKKIIRKDDNNVNKNRRITTIKPSPESIHDIHKEIKSWFINKSIGETHLHRAARLGYTDCVAYCLEKMEADPSAKDNAGFTPLHVAAAKGHVRIARLLLQYGANVSAAAQGGIRPLHEASENCHVEIIRLLLAYGADPLLVTYAGQTPEELAEGPAAKLIRLHISDVQGLAVEPWQFHHPAEIIDYEEIGCDPLSSPPPASPPPPPDSMIEIQCAEAPLPPFYTLRTIPGQPADGLWCLLQDITNLLQIKSKDSLLKQIHCGSGSPKELLREIRTQEFLERAQCHQLLCAGEKVNVRASKVALVRVTDKLRQLLKIETVLVS